MATTQVDSELFFKSVTDHIKKGFQEGLQREADRLLNEVIENLRKQARERAAALALDITEIMDIQSFSDRLVITIRDLTPKDAPR